jgi:molybdate transport repressor ModE-like protein
MEKFHGALLVRLANEKIFFGPGVVTLLKLTKELESLNAASKKMNLSYSKANKIIKSTEEALKFKLLDRKIGGPNGGGSTLTPECIDFLKTFTAYEDELKEHSDLLFEKYFKKYQE